MAHKSNCGCNSCNSNISTDSLYSPSACVDLTEFLTFSCQDMKDCPLISVSTTGNTTTLTSGDNLIFKSNSGIDIQLNPVTNELCFEFENQTITITGVTSSATTSGTTICIGQSDGTQFCFDVPVSNDTYITGVTTSGSTTGTTVNISDNQGNDFTFDIVDCCPSGVTVTPNATGSTITIVNSDGSTVPFDIPDCCLTGSTVSATTTGVTICLEQSNGNPICFDIPTDNTNTYITGVTSTTGITGTTIYITQSDGTQFPVEVPSCCECEQIVNSNLCYGTPLSTYSYYNDEIEVTGLKGTTLTWTFIPLGSPSTELLDLLTNIESCLDAGQLVNIKMIDDMGNVAIFEAATLTSPSGVFPVQFTGELVTGFIIQPTTIIAQCSLDGIGSATATEIYNICSGTTYYVDTITGNELNYNQGLSIRTCEYIWDCDELTNCNIENIGNVATGATSGDTLCFDGENWIPVQPCQIKTYEPQPMIVYQNVISGDTFMVNENINDVSDLCLYANGVLQISGLSQFGFSSTDNGNGTFTITTTELWGHAVTPCTIGIKYTKCVMQNAFCNK